MEATLSFEWNVEFTRSIEDRSPSNRTESSFYGRRFKVLRLTGESLLSLITSLFYVALSVVCYLTLFFSKGRQFRDLSDFHFNQSCKMIDLTRKYRNHIVNFSTNSTGTPVENKGKQVNEIKELRKIYGKQFDEMFKGVSTKIHTISEDKLSRYPIDQGICLGESLDFISRYLKDRSGDSFETIKKVSKLYAKQGTPEAQILQIFDKACSCNAKKLAEKMVEVETQLKRLKKLNPKESESLIHICNKKQQKNRASRFNMLTKSLGYKMYYEKEYSTHVTKEKRAPELFNQTFSDLKNGVYLTCLFNSSSNTGHAISLIKTSEASYIFDPNLATLRFDKSEQFLCNLWKLTKKYNKSELFIYKAERR